MPVDNQRTDRNQAVTAWLKSGEGALVFVSSYLPPGWRIIPSADNEQPDLSSITRDIARRP